MIIPESLLDATRSRFWRTASTPPLQIARPAAVDERADLAHELPASAPEAPYAPEAVAHVAVLPHLSPGDVLVAALDAAATEAERTALLAVAPPEARRAAQGTHVYRAMCSTAHASVAAADALEASLKAAPDEHARVAILSDAPEAQRIELVERMRQPDPLERYMQSLECGWLLPKSDARADGLHRT
jgi:hypothetical protein